jgi:pimeloyl-ACP methyl ester carboxylesterase
MSNRETRDPAAASGRRPWWKQPRWIACGVIAIAAVVAAVIYAQNEAGHVTDYRPRDPRLEREPLFYYPVRDTATARAFVFFLGNDIAFWGAHQQLAWRLSGDGYTVVGIDIRKYLDRLPDEPKRDSAFGVAIGPLIARARHEMGADSLPLILAGHSFGAELAFWIARHHAPPGLIGVLSLNSRSTGHLFITTQDWLNKEASGPFSFSVVRAVGELDPAVRIALVRGAHDPFRRHDPEFMAAGGARIQRYEVPMAGHTLKKLILAGPIIDGAMHWLDGSQSR